MQSLFPFVFLKSRKDLCLQFILHEILVCFRSIRKIQHSGTEERKIFFSELITPDPENFLSISFGSLEKLIILSRILNVKKMIRHFEFLTQKVWEAYQEEKMINEKDFRQEFRTILPDLIPFLMKEKENLLLFLLRNKDEIEQLFPSNSLKECFSDIDSLKKGVLDNYKKRGFESIVLKIQEAP